MINSINNILDCLLVDSLFSESSAQSIPSIAGRLPTRSCKASLYQHSSRKPSIMPVTIDYYMTLNSPWTYLGSALLAEIARRHDATVNVKPCKFGPIFEQTGGLPLPKRSPQRRAYRMMDLKRWREVRDIPLTLEPKYFPCDDSAAARLIIAA